MQDRISLIAGDSPVDFDDDQRAIDDPGIVDTGVRFLNLVVDMGAQEHQVATTGGCLGDLDDDDHDDDYGRRI